MPTPTARRLARRLAQSIGLLLLTLTVLPPAPALEARAAEGDKKIVFLAGAKSHGYGSHEHRAGCLLLARCLNEDTPGVQAVVYDAWPEDPAALADADAIVVFSDGNAKHSLGGHLEEVDRLMAKGVGLACLHYAVELPKGEQGDYLLDWIGGYFEVHWSVNPHWEAHFTEFLDHPVSRGVRPFHILDEWYYHMRFQPDMKGITPILTAVPPESTLQRKDGAHSGNPAVRARKGMPEHVAWAYERPGGGRGFGFTGCHHHWTWANDSFRKTVLNGIVWIAGTEVPPGGVRSKTPSFEELEADQDYPPDKKFNRDHWLNLMEAWRGESVASE